MTVRYKKGDCLIELPVHGATSLREAYVRPITVSGRCLWAVFSAQGEHLGLAESRALAFAAAVQNEMSPQSVH